MLDNIINIMGGVGSLDDVRQWSSTEAARNVPDWKVLKAAHTGIK